MRACDVHIFQAVKTLGATSGASQGALAELFGQIEKFFRRLDTYAKVTPTPEMKKVIVTITGEVLFILAVPARMFELGNMSELTPVGGRPLWAYPC